MKRKVEIKNIDLFKKLQKEELDLIRERSTIRNFNAGKIIFTEGQKADGLYVILSGRVKISKVSLEGREKTLAILEPGEFFGEMALVDGRPRSAMASTLEETEVLILSPEGLSEIFSRKPNIAVRMLGVLSRRIRETNRQLQEMVFHDTRERLWNELMHLAGERGQKTSSGIEFILDLTHRELGELIGTSRETVTRLFSRLQEEGLLEIRGKKLVIKKTD